MNQPDRVLKQDAAGRVWTPREQREAALDAFEGSGMSGSKFATHIGVKYSTFAGWVHQRRKAQSGSAATATGGKAAVVHWVEASVGGTARGTVRPIIIHLPGGARLEVLEGAQVELAAALVRALVGRGPTC